MLAKLVLFVLLCLAVYAIFRGGKRIVHILMKGDSCGCSKTGASVCHCHDKKKWFLFIKS